MKYYVYYFMFQTLFGKEADRLEQATANESTCILEHRIHTSCRCLSELIIAKANISSLPCDITIMSFSYTQIQYLLMWLILLENLERELVL